MMDSTFHLYKFLILCCFNLTVLTNSSASMQPLCHEDESSALLQFRHSFVIDKLSSGDPSAYPKVETWELEEKTTNCCSWDGVECDHNTGHVIGLDLSSSFLYGSINSNSTLFDLVHLRRLNLADNQFNGSKIPTGIGHLSRLISLNLSASAFSGQIPSEISSLSKLVFLDLSGNIDSYYENPLKLQKPSLRDLVQNLSNLKVLDLSEVNISSTLPDALSNMSSLTTLSFRSCLLYGEFPMGIFRLPNLRIVQMADNENLVGHLPEFHRGSPLEILLIPGTGFSGMLPNSIGNLESLSTLSLTHCNFCGTLPASVGNLAQLTSLSVTRNHFRGQIPSSIANLSQLTFLGLGYNSFDAGTLPLLLGKLPKLTELFLGSMKLSGEIPRSLANLTQLSILDMSENELVGQIPSWLVNLTQLTVLTLSDNQLQGEFPMSISQLKHLLFLGLGSNFLSGKVKLFLELQNLSYLYVSYNQLTMLTKNYTNATLPKFKGLGLASCNLMEFPDFLRFQEELVVLYLDNNNIHGQIPTWLWNTSKETMSEVKLGHNFLTGFEQNPDAIRWRSLRSLYLSYNRLQGSPPVPPPFILVYEVASNLLTGEIPPSFCRCNSLYVLDMSDNYLSGTIPQCLAISYSDSLLLLNLSNNNFHGTIPQTFMPRIKMIDLSQNQLHGPIPSSLANCTMLEILVLGYNQIEDNFPFWLGGLPELQVLVLGSNRFYGVIDNPKANLKFSKLRIVDLSHNGFSGNLPSEYFQTWNAMKVVKKENLTYLQMEGNSGAIAQNWVVQRSYTYSVTIASKGTDRFYEKIQSAFVAVDLSNNKFSGEIPESLGRLSGLQVLNISNNDLTGFIPSSLANLMELESLDLSRNLLSGEIPRQLTQLTFLAVLNFSHNHLTGPIPHGNQFDTFDNSSYDGNFGLCGDPLLKSCANSETSPPPPPSSQGDDSEFPWGIYWMVIFMGYGSGLIVGLVIGTYLTRMYHEWFVETFGWRKKTPKRAKRKGQRN